MKIPFLDLIGSHQEHPFFQGAGSGGRRCGDRQEQEHSRYNPVVDHLPRCTLSGYRRQARKGTE